MGQNNMGMMNNGMPQQQQANMMPQQMQQMPPTSMVSNPCHPAPSILILLRHSIKPLQPENGTAQNGMASNLMVMDPIAELQANLSGPQQAPSPGASVPSSVAQSNGYYATEPTMYVDASGSYMMIAANGMAPEMAYAPGMMQYQMQVLTTG